MLLHSLAFSSGKNDQAQRSALTLNEAFHGVLKKGEGCFLTESKSAIEATASVVILQSQVSDEFFPFKIAKCIFQLHQLDEQIMLGVDFRSTHRAFKIE